MPGRLADVNRVLAVEQLAGEGRRPRRAAWTIGLPAPERQILLREALDAMRWLYPGSQSLVALALARSQTCCDSEAVELLPLDEVQRRLRIVGQSYAGVRPIEVGRVVGSLDRSGDFDRDFKPRRSASTQRLASLRSAFPHGDMPPIEAYEVGGAFFVSDGHHRVALALERSAEFIDAEITRLETNFEIGRDVDVRQLIHTEQQRTLLQDSGLARARPDVVVEFSRPGGYPELLELIKAHGYDLARQRGRLPHTEEVAANWYDNVFAPGVAALRREALPEVYMYKTDADLFLWVYQRRRALRVLSPDADFDHAARDARDQKVSRRFRRQFLREKSSPLRSRDTQGGLRG